MAEQSSTKLTVDASGVLSGLDAIDKALEKTTAEFKQVSDAAKKTSQDTAKAMNGAIAQAQVTSLQKLESEYAALSKKAAEYEAKVKSAGSSTEKAFAEGNLVGVQVQMRNLEKEAAALGTTLKTTGDSAKTTGSDVDQLGKKGGALSSVVKQQTNDFRIFGKSIGEWRGELAGAVEGLDGGAKGAGGFAGGLRLIGTAIKASGIGLLIGIVAGVITYFTKFQSGIDKVNQVTAAAGAVINTLVDRIVKLGTAIVNFFSGDFDAAADNFSAAFDNIGGAMADAAKDAFELEKAFQALRDTIARNSILNAQQERDLARIEAALGNVNLSIAERMRLEKQAGDLRKQIAARDLADAEEALKLAQRDVDATPDNGDLKEAERKAQIAFLDAQKKAIEAQAGTENKLRELRKQAADERQKQIEKERQDLEKLAKDLEQLRVAGEPSGLDRDLAEVNRRYDALIKTATDGVEKLNEIEQRRGLSLEELSQREQFGDLAVKLEEQRLSALVDVLADFNEKEAALEQQQIENRKALTEKEKQALLGSINAQKALRDEQLKQGEASAEAFLLRLQQQGASEAEIAQARAEFDLLIQQARLRAEIEFQEKLLAATDVGDAARIAQIKAGIESLKAQLSNIDFQIENPERKPFSIFSLLGLDPNNPNFDRDVQAIKKAADEAVSAILSIADARLQAAEAAVEAANRELEAAEEKTEAAEQALEEEKELQDQGYANNVSDAEQNLALAEQFEAQKKAQRDKALQDQRKAQQAQIILDALLQSSNIITSASNIIKGFSAIPIVGGPLGIAAAATMVAGFVAAKIKAIQAVRAQQFRTGGSGYVGSDGVIVGPSHEGGGVKVPEYEGGEFFASDGKRFAVVNKKMTSKHYDLLKAINADDREGIARHAHLLSDFAPTFDIPAESMGGGIEIDRDEVARRVFGDGDSDTPVEIALAENEQLRRNNQLLEKMLAVMTKDANKGEWSADGKTFRKQGLTKRYLN